jgi:hypothetical protein
MLRRLSPFLLPLLLSSIADAQSTVLTTESQVGVFCALGGVQRQASVPAGTPIDECARVEQRCWTLLDSCGAASAALVFGDRIVLLESGSATVRVPPGGEAGTARTAALDSHSHVWTLPGARNGKLAILHAANVISATDATVAVAVDLDADGSIEFWRVGATVSSLEIAVQRPVGLRVRITTFGHVLSMLGTYDTSLELAWIANGGVPPVRVFPSDTGLGLPRCGPELWVRDEPANIEHRIELRLRDGSAGSNAILIVGVQPALIPVPGTSCFLETVPLLAVPAVIDAVGRAVWRASVPGPLRNADLFVQAAQIDAAQRIGMTNTYRLSFVD